MYGQQISPQPVQAHLEEMDDPINRYPWMDDDQYEVYCAMVRLSRAQYRALLARDRETWLKLSLRMREMNRLANDRMFR